MAGRPKYGPRRDTNDTGKVKIVEQAVEKLQLKSMIKVLDISMFPGLIDRQIFIGLMEVGIEIKVPGKRHSLTKGEKQFPGLVYVVETQEEVEEIIQALYPIAIALSSQILFTKGELKKYERITE